MATQIQQRTFIVYFTFYLGDKLPPYYIGSTLLERFKKGYHGSASSAKYGKIWKEEIKNNPQLFKTIMIPGQFRHSSEEIIDLELYWQKLFNVVEDPDFVNMSYVRCGFHTTPESSARAEETKRLNGTNTRSEETKLKIGDANRGRILPPVKQETCKKLSDSLKGRILTDEWKSKISKSLTGKIMSDETKAKLSVAHTGKKLSEEHKAKIIGTGRIQSDKTKAKIGAANKGKLLGYKRPPMSEETKEKIRQANLGKKWSLELRNKIKTIKNQTRQDRMV